MTRRAPVGPAGVKLSSQRVWGASPAGQAHCPNLAPGTPEFFEQARRRRSTEELPWLGECFPFAATRDRDVLEIGCGAGFDAFEFCAARARYVGIDLTRENLWRSRWHLGAYGYAPGLMQADAERLPFAGGRFDTVFSNGVLHHTPDLPQSLQEIRRVLRPGGTLWMTVYHKDSMFYRLYLPLDYVLYLRFFRETWQERVSRIEFTSASERPLVRVYSRAEIQRIVSDAGFTVNAVEVRKLTWQDLPGPPVICRLWQFVPERWLDWLGRRWGWYVIVRATAGEAAASAHVA